MATANTPTKGARGKKPIGPKPGEFPGKIVDIDVSQEISESFLEYAYSVIYSRALPDARDGLKPVHRRILHQMSEMGLRPERGHVKSARVVGEVMGKLHPHGDGAIYDALVRMAQSFSMALPLIDGHGNFGSLDSGPAAMRYTEARLARAAMTMVAETDEDTVDFAPNYDGQIAEPMVLPAAYPNLLVNGGSGIAVGMATNMAPHNLGEVIAATKHLIENPSATIKALMKFIPGPDFPTGGEIVGLEGVREAYATGKGSFKVRATVEISKVTTRKMGITVKELPFNIGPEAIIDIDKVIKIIRGSQDAQVAKSALIKGFKLNDEQATYILDMPLRRLTKVSKIELETEQKELKATIVELTKLLKSDETIKAQVAIELTQVRKDFATPRRTRIGAA